MTNIENINVEIISPKGKIFEDSCNMVSIPAKSGEIGIMSDHESVATILQSGVINIIDKSDKVIKSFEISGGFAEIIEKKLLILID